MSQPILIRFVIWASLGVAISAPAQADLRDDALAAAKKATSFLVDHVSTEGGYLWAYSADLKTREGEGVVNTETIWVQPPGTPSVGEAFVKLYQATGDQQFLVAARKAAESLRRGQMRSGGWQAMVEFEPDRRRRWAYRIDKLSNKAKDQSSLDDDKTQSALRFLIELDRSLEFGDPTIHEMALYGLDKLIRRGQFSGGGFPQVWTDRRSQDLDTPFLRANYPSDWPREYPGHNEYWYRYTLNDHLARDVMKLLLLAHQAYGDDTYHASAIKLADSLLAAQMPNPQPAWAQQYNSQMQPIWARKFEPPAITTSESFGVIETLMMVYRETGNPKYLATIPRALDYLESCELPDGQVARFYELQTNRPLYFTTDYKLTYDDSDVPTHYGFKLPSQVGKLRKQYERVSQLTAKQLAERGRASRPPSVKVVQTIIDQLDNRGAWLSENELRYSKVSGPSIEMSIAVKHLKTLAEYLANTSPK
ncbi:pectate lyase [Aporhodopirellula aestuarii]|uniref:Pectate lyase n=1 Tax=Aporhodopirellula aestuarii TaxID=2950107 RepID=A0ABT0U6J5_9BACT|nr:pectate lyase [Aporhodopirellula aestuarii]MCM2372294.1 pectate lyase [Aporhodopirellula aestuarii]